MTEEQADAKIKELKGPFARAIDRSRKPTDEWPKYGVPRYYVGWSPCFGNGDTWEEAFDNLKREHAFLGDRRFPRCKFNAPIFRARRATLKERF